jgi:hypothetical protein
LSDSIGGEDMSEQNCNLPVETIVGGFKVDLVAPDETPTPKVPRPTITDSATAALVTRPRLFK